MAGVIASSGFASGDRIVVGHWVDSPIGPFTDVMWTAPDGTRTLLSPTERAEAFITAVYSFDRTSVVDVAAEGGATGLEVTAGPLRVGIAAGRPWLVLPRRRPAWFTRWVEDRVARATMGVRTFGESPTGVREWYRADRYRPAREAWASVGGRDLGAMAPLHPPLGVGFTDPPRRPSIVAVRPLLEDPTGGLDRLVAGEPSS
ncbi:hypothetical protein [Actinomarinicola tropica]|uniref:Uncharacterized protein n=1 Tax=Actinomarinicola tropica TaxID=2789776 RepID=A0A5Q2RKB3_9ACTN|nr:hypothetical protein [Actinomarinicola tropica]QGG95362.1 hypothetical protein GH723_09775 [Actinomarinicola tropica]